MVRAQGRHGGRARAFLRGAAQGRRQQLLEGGLDVRCVRRGERGGAGAGGEKAMRRSQVLSFFLPFYRGAFSRSSPSPLKKQTHCRFHGVSFYFYTKEEEKKKKKRTEQEVEEDVDFFARKEGESQLLRFASLSRLRARSARSEGKKTFLLLRSLNSRLRARAARLEGRRSIKPLHVLGPPPSVASGNRSTVYLLPLRYITGTPGIFLTRLLRSLSQVATM